MTTAQVQPEDRRRHRRWIWWAVGVLLTAAMVVGILLSLREGPVQGQIKVLAEQQLSRYLRRKVRIGRVYGRLWRGLVLEDITIAGGEGTTEPLLQLSQLHLRYRLGSLLRGKPLQSVRAVTLVEPRLRLERDPQGRWNLLELLPKPKVKPTRPPPFTGRVEVRGGVVQLVDYQVGSASDPLHAQFRGVNVAVSFLRPGVMRVRLQAQALAPRLNPPLPPSRWREQREVGRVRVQGTVKLLPLTFDLRARVEETDLGFFRPYLAFHREVQVQRGFLNARARWQLQRTAEGKTEVDFTAVVRLREVSVHLAALGRPLEVAQGEAEVTPQGVRLRNFQAQIGRSQLVLNGRVDNFAQPYFNLHAAASPLFLDELPMVLPQVKLWRHWQAKGPARLEVRLRGTPRDLAVRGTFDLPPLRTPQVTLLGARGELDVHYGPGSGGLGGVQGTVAFDRAGFVLPRTSLPVTQVRGQVQVLGEELYLQRLSARLGRSPVWLDGAVRGLPRNLSFDLRVVTPRLWVADVKRALSPWASAEGRMAVLQQVSASGAVQADLHLRGSLSSLFVRGGLRLPPLAWPGGQLRGLRADLALSMEPRRRWLEGTVRLEEVGFQVAAFDLPVSDLHGTLTFRGQWLAVQNLRAQVGDSPVLLEGVVSDLPRRPRLALDLASPRLYLTPIVRALLSLSPRLRGVEVLRGLESEGPAAVDVHLGGSLRNLAVVGRLRLPPLHHPQGDLFATTATLDLRYRPGTGVRGVSGTVAFKEGGFRWAEFSLPVTNLRGTVRLGEEVLAFHRLAVQVGRSSLWLNGEVSQIAAGTWPQVALTVISPHLEVPELRAALADLKPLGEVEILQQLEAQGSAWLNLALRGTPEDWTLVGEVEVPDLKIPEGELARTRARLDLRYQKGGPGVYGLRGQVDLVRAGFRWAGFDLPVTQLAGHFDLADDRVAVSGLRARVGRSPVRVEGTVSRLTDPQVALTASSAALDLAELQSALAKWEPLREVETLQQLQTEGSAQFDLTVQGTRRAWHVAGDLSLPCLSLPQGQLFRAQVRVDLDYRPDGSGVYGVKGTVEVQEAALEAAQFPLPVRDLKGKVALGDDAVTLTELRAQVGRSRVAVEGTVAELANPHLALRVVAPVLDLAEIRQALPNAEALPQVEISGLAAANLEIAGIKNDLQVAGEVALPKIGLAEGLSLRQGQARLAIGYRPGTGIGGVSGSVEAQKVVFTLPQLQAPVEEVQGKVILGPRRLTLHDVSARVGESQLSVEGTVWLAEDRNQFDLHLTAPQVAVGQLKELLPEVEFLSEVQSSTSAQADLQVWGELLIPASPKEGAAEGGWRLRTALIRGQIGLPQARFRDYGVRGGTVEVELTVLGPTGERGWRVVGTADLTEVGAEVPPLAQPLTDLTGRLEVNDNYLRAEHLTARLGESELRLTAEVRDFAQPQFTATLEELRLAAGQLPTLLPQVEALEDWRGEGYLTGRLQAAGTFDQMRVKGELHLPSVEYRGIAVRGGRLRLRGRMALSTSLHFWGWAELRGVAAQVPQLALPLTGISGEISVAAERLTLHQVAAQLGRSLITVDGSLFGFTDPQAELTVTTSQLDAGELLSALQVETQLPILATPQPLKGKVIITGKLTEPLIALDVRVPEAQVAFRGPGEGQRAEEGATTWGPFQIREAVLHGTVLGGTRPQMRLTVETAALDLNQLKQLAPEPEQFADLQASQPARLQATVTGPVTNPLVTGTVEVEQLALGEVPIHLLRANFRYLDQLVTVSDLTVKVGEGTLTGEGSLDLGGEPRRAFAALEAEEVELALVNAFPWETLAGQEIGGRLSGTFQVKWEGGRWEAIGRAQVLQGRYRDLSLRQADATFALRGPRLEMKHLLVRDPLGTLEAQGTVDFEQELDLRVWAPEVELQQLARWFPEAEVEGKLTLTAHVTGSLEHPLVTGRAEAFLGQAFGFPFHRLLIVAEQVSEREVELTAAVSGEAYRLRIAGRVSDFDWKEKKATLDGSVTFEQLDLAPVLSLAGVDFPAAGRLRGQVTVQGTLPHPNAEGQLTWEQGTLAGVQVPRAEGKFRLGENTLQVDELRVELGTSEIALRGRIDDVWETRRLALNLVAPRLRYEEIAPLAKLPLVTEGELRVEGEFTGEVADPVVSVRVHSPAVVLNGEQFADLRAEVTYARQKVFFNPVEFSAFAAHYRAAGAYDLEQQRLNAVVDVAETDLGQLIAFLDRTAKIEVGGQRQAWQAKLQAHLGLIPRPVKGKGTLKATLQGPVRSPAGRVELALTGVRLGDKPVPELRSKVALGPRERRTTPAEVEAQPGCWVLTGGVDLDGDLALRLEADKVALQDFAPWVPLAGGLKGEAQLDVVARGSIKAPVVEAHFRAANPQVGPVQFNAVRVEGLTLRKGELNLGQVALRAGETVLTAQGTVPLKRNGFAFEERGPLNVQTELRVPDLRWVKEITPEVEEVEGSLEVALHLTGTKEQPVLNGYWKGQAPRLKVASGRQTLCNAVFEVNLKGNQREGNTLLVNCLQVEWEGGQFQVAPGSTVELNYWEPADWLRNRFNLQVRAKNLAGGVRDVLKIEEGKIDIAVRPGEGEAFNIIECRSLQAKINGGLAVLTGRVRLTKPDAREFLENDFDLWVKTEKVAAAYGKFVSALVDADLHLTSQPGTVPLRLSGTVKVTKAAAGSSLLLLFIRRRKGEPVLALPAWPELDITVRAERDNWIRSEVPEIVAPVQAVFHLSHTPQDLRLSGQAMVERGRARVSTLTGEYQLKPSTAEVNLRRNPYTGTFDPFVDVKAEVTTQIEKYDPVRKKSGKHRVNLKIEGHIRPGVTAPVESKWHIRATSSPPLPEVEIYAALTRREEFAQALAQGNLAEFLQTELTDAAAKTVADWALRGVEETIAETLGVEEFTITYELAQALQVHVGTHLIKNVFVTYTTNVGGREKYTFRVDYEIDDDLRVGFSTNERSDQQWNAEYYTEF